MTRRLHWIVIFFVTISVAAQAAETGKKKPTRVAPAATAEKKMAATRALLIERMRASRQKLRDALPYYEREIEKQSADYELKKQMYEARTVPFSEVEDSERRLANTQQTKAQVEHWITEDDIALALTPEAAEEQSERLE